LPGLAARLVPADSFVVAVFVVSLLLWNDSTAGGQEKAGEE
jgi:hypothetical protein